MSTTPLSLLDRLKRAKPNAEGWHRLQEIYLPLIRGWLAYVPGLREDDDLTQEVPVLSRELPSFERRRDGAFRAWLRQLVRHRILSWSRARRDRPHFGLGGEA